MLLEVGNFQGSYKLIGKGEFFFCLWLFSKEEVWGFWL